jgi:hypothetical protein
MKSKESSEIFRKETNFHAADPDLSHGKNANERRNERRVSEGNYRTPGNKYVSHCDLHANIKKNISISSLSKQDTPREATQIKRYNW